MSRNSEFGAGRVVLFIITALFGAFAVVQLIGRDSPARSTQATTGGLQADLLVYPIAIGLTAAAVIVAVGWWYYG
jgi:hypothetical protein